MQIPILIEPTTGGFRARSGEPFAASAEGPTAEDATQRLRTLLRDRFQDGSRLPLLDLATEPLPDDDWFFKTLREEIEANRRREDEADQ